ncbi:MAG: hypothetical protein IJT83_09860 [Victivallales bacterium]|nr:hypothetical protein [Victivallales bacterium]
MLVPFRKYAVGYDWMIPGGFPAMVEPYLPTVKEVFFSWPGMVSGRAVHLEKSIEESIEQLCDDLSWCRRNGVELDLLFNANCYGEDAFTENLRTQVYDVMEHLGRRDLFPEIVTTTSQYIAKVLKVRYPQVEIRASVNMKLESTKAMEYIADIFDSYYICRDIQRDRNVLRHFSDWCNDHGKKLCMLVNSACLRCCPVQIWHDNYLCHKPWKAEEQEFILHYPARLCGRVTNDIKNAAEILRMSWIRPEDIHCYEPYVAAMKLATRSTVHPERMLKAYAEGRWDGDLLAILGNENPNFTFDNTAFPADWIESGIAQNCAINCTGCGKCDDVLKKVLRTRKTQQPKYSLNI